MREVIISSSPRSILVGTLLLIIISVTSFLHSLSWLSMVGANIDNDVACYILTERTQQLRVAQKRVALRPWKPHLEPVIHYREVELEKAPDYVEHSQ